VRFAGTGAGAAEAATTGAEVAVGAGVGMTFSPLLHTIFFPDLMQVYLKPETVFICPLILQVAPALIAADVEGIVNKFVNTSKTTTKGNFRFI
jgi:hypothetical protein